MDLHPGHTELLQILSSFLDADAVPGFIHVHAPISTRHTLQFIQTLLARTTFLYSFLNGIECFSSRLFYHRILQTIQKQSKVIPPEEIQQYTSDLGNFLRALRLILRKSDAKGIIIVLDRPEKLKESLPELWTPLSRLDELAGIPISVITISQASWFELRPLDGSAIHPFLVNVKPYSKKDSQTFLTSLFPSRPNPPLLSPYNPAFKPLFSHFISAVINICYASLIDELELGYIASACWPIFVQPILNQWKQAPQEQLDLPDEDARIRLTKYFTPLIANALEMLYPRVKHIKQWSRENAFPEDITLLDILQTSAVYQPKSAITAESDTPGTNTNASASASISTGIGSGSHHLQRIRENQYQLPQHIRSLTTIAKFILIAGFLASHNPHKSDLKLFGRSVNDGKGRRKKGGGTVKTRVGVSKGKVPQKLLGPMVFPLDRLVAIVGSLMEEYYLEQREDEDDSDPDRHNEDKDIEMVVGRVQVSATITELVNQGLLHRITPEKNELEAMTYKSTISHACAFALARQVGIKSLKEYMYHVDD